MINRLVVLAGLAACSMSASAGIINDYNLITLGNLDSTSEVEGRALIVGDINGANSSNYGTMLLPRSAYSDIDVLTVIGNVTSGGALQVDAGDFRHGGTVGRQVNTNGVGGQTFFDAGLGTLGTNAANAMNSLSAHLLTLTADSSAPIPGPQPGPLVFNCNGSGDGIAVFNVVGSQVFSNNNVQQLELNVNGASAVVINVSGTNINFNQGNMVGNWNSLFARANVIWNFFEATNIIFDRAMNGAVLAPHANLRNNTVIEGSTFVGGTFTQRGEVHLPGYTGYVPAPGAAGLLGVAGLVAARRRR